MFRDEDFAALYCPDNGRQSVPPSVAVSVLFLRPYQGGELCRGRRAEQVRSALEGSLWTGDRRGTDAEERAAGV